MAGEQSGFPLSFRSPCVTVSKSPLLRETRITTSELAASVLEIGSFDDRVLNILTAGLFSAHLNLSLAQVSHRHYFAEAQSQFWGLCAPYDDCDWFREKQTRQSIFSSIQECVCVESDLSPALSAVERRLARRDYPSPNMQSSGPL